MMQSSIQDLPPEVLIIVFELAFTNTRCHERHPGTIHKELYTPSFLQIASLVCKHWNDTVLLAPTLWTRLIIFVDAKSTSPSRVQSHLDLSLNLPLDIYVLRHPETYGGSDSEEYLRCGIILNMLIPHFHRCQIINFNVIHSSSLPSIYREFRGHWPHLTQLLLNCRVDDGEEFNVRVPYHTSHESLTFPFLRILNVNGRNFTDACLDLPSWKRCLSQTNSLDVTISNFMPTLTSPDYDCRPLDLIQALSSIPKIGCLRLDNLDLDGWEGWEEIEVNLSMGRVELVDLHHEFLVHFFDAAFLESDSALCKRCSLSACLTLVEVEELTLEELPDDTDYAYVLAIWSGRTLSVINCPTFDDSVLEVLSDLSLVEPDFRHPWARSVFYFTGCPNISVDAVKNLMKDRTDALQNNDICELYVSSANSKPSKADETWFRRHLGRYSWET